jgi:hypothetical protein
LWAALHATRVVWDSKWLVIPDKNAPTEPFGLFLVSVESGEKRRLATGTALGDYARILSGWPDAGVRGRSPTARPLCVCWHWTSDSCRVVSQDI